MLTLALTLTLALARTANPSPHPNPDPSPNPNTNPTQVTPTQVRGGTGRWSKGEAAALKAERAAFLAAARLSLGKLMMLEP